MITLLEINQYRDPEIMVTCDSCGKAFYRLKKELKRQAKKRGNQTNTFCSQSCSSKYGHKDNKVQFTTSSCEYCGETFKHKKKKSRKYCSNACTSRATASGRAKIMQKMRKESPERFPLRAGALGTGYSLTYHRYYITCIKCGKGHLASKEKVKYCSRACYPPSTLVRRRITRSRAEIRLQHKLETLLQTVGIRVKGNDKKAMPGWQIDITIPQLKIAIEWNGPHHYEIFGKWTEQKQKDLERRQHKDRYKIGKLKGNGWRVLEIKSPYDIENNWEKRVEMKWKDTVLPFLESVLLE